MRYRLDDISYYFNKFFEGVALLLIKAGRWIVSHQEFFVHLLPGRGNYWTIDFSQGYLSQIWVYRVMSLAIFVGLLAQAGVWFVTSWYISGVTHSIVTAMMASMFIDAGGQFFARRKIDLRQVVYASVVFGSFNGFLIYYWYVWIAHEGFWMRWLYAALYSNGVTVLYFYIMQMVHYYFLSSYPSQYRNSFTPEMGKKKIRQLLSRVGVLHTLRHGFVQGWPDLSVQGRTAFALITGSMVAVLGSYISNRLHKKKESDRSINP